LRSALVPLAAVIAALLGPGASSAWGHAAFLDSQPEPGSRLASGPAEITLRFSEPLDRSLSQATLVNVDSGETVAATTTREDQSQLTLQPQTRLDRAPYRVEWHTVSTVDGHALEGSFSFGVQTAAAGGEHTLEEGPLARDGWLRIAARALFYAALFFFAGGVFTAALLSRGRAPASWLVPPPEERAVNPGGSAVVKRAWRRTLDAGWVAVGAAVLVALVEAADAAGGLSLRGAGDFLLSNAAGLARTATLLALLIAALLARRLPLAASAWLGIAFLAVALGGHANSAEPRALAVLTDWLHLLAGAVWIGGIAQIVATWFPANATRPESRTAALRSVLPRFGTVALPAFLVVIASGLANALIELGHPQELWQSAYGRVLAVKVGLVGLIGLASYTHAFHKLLAANPHPGSGSERRHWRAIGSEPLLAVGVIAAAAVLVTFPLPPQQVGDADEASATAPCESCPLPRAKRDQLAVAEQAGSRIAAFWLERRGGAVSGTLRLLDSNAGAVDAPVDLEGGELIPCGTGCWRLSVADSADALTVVVEEDGDPYTATVPTAWDPARQSAGRRLLRQAQERMRSLASLRLDEELTSGPGSFVRTRYRFQAPDRIAYRTSSGSSVIGIGRTAYRSTERGGWGKGPFGADGFQLEQFFRWTAYAGAVRWLGTTEVGGRPAIELAVYDPATPLWYRLSIDGVSRRIVRERMIAEGHFMDRRYFAFDAGLRIRPPR
jgi:copper transport protein